MRTGATKKKTADQKRTLFILPQTSDQGCHIRLCLVSILPSEATIFEFNRTANNIVTEPQSSDPQPPLAIAGLFACEFEDRVLAALIVWIRPQNFYNFLK